MLQTSLIDVGRKYAGQLVLMLVVSFYYYYKSDNTDVGGELLQMLLVRLPRRYFNTVHTYSV
jgi:hypothetical protein